MRTDRVALRSILLLLVLSLILGACKSNEEPGKTVLRFSWWGSQTRHDRTIKVIEMYEAAHPDIDIQYDYAGNEVYWAKMIVQAAARNLPDIMQQDYATLGTSNNKGLLLDLTPYVEDGTLDFSSTPDSFIQGGMIDNKLLGVNLGNNSQAFVLDVDAFEKAGVPLPAPDWTWKDYEEACMQLHEKLNIWCMDSNLGDEQVWSSIYLGLGEWIYNQDQTGPGYTSDQPFIDFLNMQMRLQKAGAIPGPNENTGDNIESGPIVTGKSAMTYIWSNQLIALWEAAGADRNFVLVPLPRAEGAVQSANYIKPSQFLSVTSDSEHPREAAEFINYFVNSTEANKTLLAERGIPASSTVREMIVGDVDLYQQAVFSFIDTIKDSAAPINPPEPAGHNDLIDNVYWPLVLEPFYYGKDTAEHLVPLLREKMPGILAENK